MIVYFHPAADIPLSQREQRQQWKRQ